jgi:4-hydroxy-4-methyl-2-oxoglutarate aldolase
MIPISLTEPSTLMLDTLKRLGSATVHEAQGQTGALASGIKPIDATLRVAGPALTVRADPGDNLIVHYALTLARPGDVIVIDAGGFLECGLWGDILTLAAIKAGVAGIVVDGAIRDADGIMAMRFPAFARGLSIRAAQKSRTGVVNRPISCGGVLIEAGDIVIGDRDGVVAVASAHGQLVLAAAEQREAKENQLRAGIGAGRTTVELLELAPKLISLGLL